MNRHQKPGKIRVVADKRQKSVPRRRASDRVSEPAEAGSLAQQPGEGNSLLVPTLIFLGGAALGGAGFVMAMGGL